MADVVEVIHKINYEVNDDGLKRASATINTQIVELRSLVAAVKDYQKELNALGSSAGLDVLIRKIDQASRQMEISLSKAKGLLSQLGNGLMKGLGVGIGLEQAVANWVAPVAKNIFSLGGNIISATDKFSSFKESVSSVNTNNFSWVSSATKGIADIGSSSSSTASVLAGLGSKLLSLETVIPLVIELFIGIDSELSKASKSAIEFSKRLEEAGEVGKEIGAYAAEEIADLFVLRQRIENVNNTYADRKKAVGELMDQYPAYFEKLSEEEVLAGKVGDAYARVVENMLNKAKLKVFNQQLEEAVAAVEGIKAKIDLVPAKDKNDVKLTNNGFNQNSYGKYNYWQPDVSFNDSKGLGKLFQEYNKQSDIIQSLTGKIDDIRKLIVNDKPTNSNTPNNPTSRKFKDQPTRPEDYLQSRPTRGVDQFPVPEQLKPSDTKFDTVNVPDFKTPRMPSKAERFMFGDTADIKDPEQRRRKEIIQSIDAYKQLTQAAVDAYQTITDAQIRALDKEIEVRQKRVDAATKLAERGNTEVLRIEEERLNKAQKKREEIARKQMIVNAALAVSNAIAGVAETATTGPAAIVLIPAVIAAIIAGYAAVSAVTKESAEQAFADGVVGYKGKGGPRDDMNRVWISSGESVITAEGTAKNRALLESINKGAQFSMLAPQLNPMYQLQSPAGGGYASRGEMHTLEKKMDTLIDAVSANGTTVHANVDERGLSLMTVKQIKRDQNRFR